MSKPGKPHTVIKPFHFKVPTELWDEIIEVATDIPAAYTLHDYYKIEAFCSEIHGTVVGSAYRNSMSTKIALSKTSKYFNSILKRFILRYIRIEFPGQLFALLEASRNQKIGQEESCLGKDMARWTVRVELAIDNGHIWMAEHTLALSEILGTCKSMSCFSTLFTPLFGVQFESLKTLLPLGESSQLKRLEARIDGDIEKLLEPLRSSLVILCLTGKSCNTVSCEFPQLRVLITNNENGHQKQIIAPKLQACIVANGEDSPKATPRPDSDPDLVVDAAVIEYLSPCLLEKNMLFDLPNWPSLKALRFRYTNLVDWKCAWPDAGSTVRNLDCILIDNFVDRLPADSRSRHLQENLEQLTRSDVFPNLKTFKFLLPKQDQKTPRPYLPDEDHCMWLNWLLRCERRESTFLVSQGVKEWVDDCWLKVTGDGLLRRL